VVAHAQENVIAVVIAVRASQQTTFQSFSGAIVVVAAATATTKHAAIRSTSFAEDVHGTSWTHLRSASSFE
jgi:hypothetical protein